MLYEVITVEVGRRIGRRELYLQHLPGLGPEVVGDRLPARDGGLERRGRGPCREGDLLFSDVAGFGCRRDEGEGQCQDPLV